MIVNMQRVTVLCLASHQQSAVSALREIGVVHVEHVQPPASQSLQDCEDQLTIAKRCLDYLTVVETEMSAPPDSAETQPSDGDAVIEEISALIARYEEAQEKCDAYQRELGRIEPLGSFEPEQVYQLESQGIFVRVFTASAKQPITVPEGAVLKILHESPTQVWFAVITSLAAQKPQAGWDSFELPEYSYQQLKTMFAETEQERATVRRRFEQLVGWKQGVQETVDQLTTQRAFLQVRDGMGSANQVAFLQGYCPTPEVECLRQAAADNGWGLVVRAPHEDEQPPTLIKYHQWVKPIKTIFDFLQIMPGYREADISIVFLMFFSVFFGILIGDAGYGILFLIATLVLRQKMSNAPQYPFTLFIVLSCSTIIWGVLTGNYFGITTLPGPFAMLKIEWLEDDYNVMGLCFLIGALHLTVAHTWNAVVLFPQGKAFEQIGWLLLVWVMFWAASAMVLGRNFPNLGFVFLAVGAVLIVLFMTPLNKLKEDWILHVMLPLNFVSMFVDLVSYVRLFAVGLASLSVASSFNDIALQMGASAPIAWVGAVLVLLLGHTLNIALCAMGILVHGVRLNTLEFSMHKQLTWSGHPYKPFSKEQR